MCLRQGRANHGQFDIPLHPPTATNGNTQERNIKKGIWPINNYELIAKHLKQFLKFANSIDFDKLKQSHCQTQQI
jgi:hypothetical protein